MSATPWRRSTWGAIKNQYDSFNFTSSEGELVAAQNWMSKLPDGMRLSDVCMPGVRDAGTAKVSSNHAVQRQQLDIYDMLNAGIRLDGADVEASNYTAEPGSVVVTLKAGYLEGLATGSYTMVALFDDGNSPTAKFTVKPAAGLAAGQATETDGGSNKGQARRDPVAADKSALPVTGDPMRTLPGIFAAATACCMALVAVAMRMRGALHRGKRARR